jgi:MoxR-like ATPase
MTDDPIGFLRYHEDPIDWDAHARDERKRAAEHLAGTRDAARLQDLRAGARQFCPPKALVNAINAAIASRSPLLLMGEPGTGKTETAYYVARYFGLDDPYHFQVRSDSTARDLRWDFDAVAYLHDAYLAGRDGQAADRLEQLRTRYGDPRAADRYLKKGVLWQAYEHQGDCVLLIDEIDKAPRDFPNDLLLELSQHRFRHPFLEQWVERPEALGPPLLIITSNGERRLPDPFLRRCIVHRIVLDRDLLQRILRAWSSRFAERLPDGFDHADWPATEDAGFERFMQVRDKLANRGRPPGAAELLVWMGVLASAGVTRAQLEAQSLAETIALGCLVKEPDDLGLLGGGPVDSA